MRRPRTIAPLRAAVLLSAVASLLLSAAAGAAPSKSQTLFAKLLLADAKTSSVVKSLLGGGEDGEDAGGGGFVAPEIQFTDLTGDGRSDAVVVVDGGGLAGGVALYVFSTHGKARDSELRAIYRSQRLYHATPSVSGASLIVQVPRFESGDDACCPGKILERTYSWSDTAKTLVRRSMRELPGPA